MPYRIHISQHAGRWLATCEHCGRVSESEMLEHALLDARQHALDEDFGRTFEISVAGRAGVETVLGLGEPNKRQA